MFTRTGFLYRWLPALVMMLVIFIFSAQSSSNLPDFDWLDRIVKKGGHVVGYGLLAFGYWRGLDFNPNQRWLAWILAILYAAGDELHQSFVPGRSPSVWDVMIFDNVGAIMALQIAGRYVKQGRTALPVAAEQAGR